MTLGIDQVDAAPEHKHNTNTNAAWVGNDTYTVNINTSEDYNDYWIYM